MNLFFKAEKLKVGLNVIYAYSFWKGQMGCRVDKGIMNFHCASQKGGTNEKTDYSLLCNLSSQKYISNPLLGKSIQGSTSAST